MAGISFDDLPDEGGKGVSFDDLPNAQPSLVQRAGNAVRDFFTPAQPAAPVFAPPGPLVPDIPARYPTPPGYDETNLSAADKAMKLSPQERGLYERHLTYLNGPGGVDNPDGSRSTLYQAVVQHGDRFYNIPTVWDGAILPVPEAAKRAEQAGWDSFPSYASPEDADARYAQMHGFMDRDTAAYLGTRGASEPYRTMRPLRREQPTATSPAILAGESVMGAVGRGAKEGFGDQPLGVSPEEGTKAPLTWLQFQPIAAPIDAFGRAVNAGVTGLARGGEELVRQLGGSETTAGQAGREIYNAAQAIIAESMGRGGHRAEPPNPLTSKEFLERAERAKPEAPTEPPEIRSTLREAGYRDDQIDAMSPALRRDAYEQLRRGNAQARPARPAGAEEPAPPISRPALPRPSGEEPPTAAAPPQPEPPPAEPQRSAKPARRDRTAEKAMAELDEMLGPEETPARAEPQTEVDRAAAEANTQPTEAQKEAGNYKKGHVNVQGLDVTIENPRGSERTGVDAEGNPWSVQLLDHYGYIKRTEGADGEHIDTYVGPNPESDRAFVVDQRDADTKKFDEHKVLLGYDTPGQALDAYENAFSDGRGHERIGAVTEMPVPQLKQWLKEGDTTKPIAKQELPALPTPAEKAPEPASAPSAPSAEPGGKAPIERPQAAAEAPTGFDRKSLPDTRGHGHNFHGSPREVELDNDVYGSSTAYYGHGLYTTDAADVAAGYAKRGRSKTPHLYQVTEKRPLKLYDMEAPVSPALRAKIDELGDTDYGNMGEVVEAALADKPKNLREFYDAAREAAGHEVTADEVQEGLFQPISDFLIDQGYSGMTHRGGLRTNTPEHRVTIYFNAADNVSLKKLDKADIGTLGEKPATETKTASSRARAALSVTQFLAANGGLKPDAELRSMGLKPADFGLFGSDKDQGELFRLARTPEANGVRTDLEKRISDAIERMIGRRVEIRFSGTLPLEGVVSDGGWGSYAEGRDTAAGLWSATEKIIRLAMDDPAYAGNEWTTAHHEAFHAVEDLLLNDRELAMLKREDGRLRKIVNGRLEFDPKLTAEQLAALSDKEVRALAFEVYVRDREQGQAPRGFGETVRRIFERIRQLLRRIRNAIEGLGFRTAEDVFRAVYEGKVREEADATERGTMAGAAAALDRGESANMRAGGFRPPQRRAENAVAKTAAQFKNFWRSTFQPELVSDRAFAADPLFARYKAAQAQEKDAIIRSSERNWEYWNKRPEAEQLAFVDDVEHGRRPADPVQAAMAPRYRTILDANWAEEKRYGSQASFVDDYFPHIWEKPEEWRAFAEAKSQQVGPTWFQKKRTIDYIQDGLAAGLKLKYTNPIDILTHRLLSGVDMRQRMELLHRLRDMGLAWEGANGGEELTRRGWRAINAPDRKQWVIAPDVQLLWKNAVEAKGLWQAEHVGGSIFRGWMAFKNAWVPVKLAASAFHPLHVLHINYSNGMGLAWNDVVKGKDPIAALKHFAEGFYGPLTAAPGASAGAIAGSILGSVTPIGPVIGGMAGSIAGAAAYGAAKRAGMPAIPNKGAAARSAWSKRPSQQTPAEKALVALMTDGGFVPQLSEQLKISAKRQFATALQKIIRGEAGASDWRKAITAGMRRPIEILQGPIFEKWIPSLKAAAYLNEAAALLKRRPELLDDHTARRIALRALAQQIDSRYGEKFYGTMFWNRYLKDAAIGSFLSLGWNYGFVHQFGGAAIEAVTRPSGLLPPFRPSAGRQNARDATNKIPFVLAYVLSSFAILGAMSMAMDDEHRYPEGLDWIFPRIGGKNPDGSPRRITHMSYVREAPMLLKHVQERGGNWLSGAGEMLWNKLMFQPFHELLTNRNYYGYNIWDENAPAYQQVWQALKYVFGEQTNPMSVTGAKRAAELSGKPFPTTSEAVRNPPAWLEAARAKGVAEAMLGFGPAPSYVERSATQNRIAYLFREHVSPEARTFEEGQKAEEKKSARDALLVAKQSGDKEERKKAAQRAVAAGMTVTGIRNTLKLDSDIAMFRRLPAADQRSILKEAADDERKKYLPYASRAVKAQMQTEDDYRRLRANPNALDRIGPQPRQ